MAPLRIPVRTLGSLLLKGFCPRCFWIQLHCENKLPFQIQLPGIFSSIDAYGKNVVHSFFEQNKRLPPWFPGIGEVTGYVPSKQLHWSKFMVEHQETGVILRGTPDDIFRLSDSSYHIVDYKTARVTETQDELLPLYEVQLNAYAHICDVMGELAVSALSLIYLEPQTKLSDEKFNEVHGDSGFSLGFSATLIGVERKPGGFIPELMRRAREIYDQPTVPEGRDGCENCDLLRRLLNIAS